MKKDFDFTNINIEDYEKIDIKLDDIKKGKMKSNLRNTIKRNKSRKRMIAASVAFFTLATTVGITSQPVFAQKLPILDSLYKSLGFYEKYLPESDYIGKTVSGDGVTVTLENIIGTKHVIKVALKVEGSGTPVYLNANLKGVESEGSMGVAGTIDDNTHMEVINLVSKKGFPNRGKLEINISSVDSNLNETLTLDVDFSSNYNKSLKKEIDTTIKSEDKDMKIKGMESTPIGTLLEIEGYDITQPDWINLKVDDKIYQGIGGMFGDEKSTYVIYPQATYEDVKDCKKISLIQDIYPTNVESNEEISKLTDEELAERNVKYTQRELELTKVMDSFQKAEKSGVSYTKEIVFNNGNKAEIYDVKRENDIVTVYLKGNDSKQLLAVALKMSMWNEDNTRARFLNRVIETTEGYAVEFSVVNGEKVNVKFELDSLALTAENIRNEIKLNVK